MFKKILIANRGEIAVRIMRTCREMGIETVAVYSEVDRHSLHVLEADQAIHIGPAEPSQSYLNISKIIDVARQTGAEAIHPGYGFLAENPVFARECENAGITFIGPPAQVIEDLGNKTVARQIMTEARVPVIPGMLEATTDVKKIFSEADRIGYPVLIKAASGGGGKGMRIVADSKEIQEACLSAMSEAEKAFGDPNIYLEKCLVSPRHIEIQILADSHGNVIHIFERECSIQRRHQKIIEETPSPALTETIRGAMGRAAVAAAKASGYVNAGTVEFLMEPSGDFYFLEVNTRLQVEHPVTELTTGIDIVRQQIHIAARDHLAFKQEDIKRKGHAIECRIYAEDAEANFFPCPGKILFYKEPAGPGIRVDSGVYEGFEVPMHYDPIVSKLICLGEDRELARARMIRALENYPVLGIKTIIPVLLDIIRSTHFKNGQTYTNFIDTHFKDWKQDESGIEMALVGYIADDLDTPKRRHFGPDKKSVSSPWETLGEWKIYD